MSKTPADLTPVEAMALAQSIRIAECNDVSALPEQTSHPVDFTVHVRGNVKRGVGTPRRGTNRARTSASNRDATNQAIHPCSANASSKAEMPTIHVVVVNW